MHASPRAGCSANLWTASVADYGTHVRESLGRSHWWARSTTDDGYWPPTHRSEASLAAHVLRWGALPAGIEPETPDLEVGVSKSLIADLER